MVAAEVELGARVPPWWRAPTRVEALGAQGLTGRRRPCACTPPACWCAAATSRRRRRLAAVRLGRRHPLTVRLLARDVRGELAVAAGRRAEALSHLRRGTAELHAWQSAFGSLDLQTLVVGHGDRLGGARARAGGGVAVGPACCSSGPSGPGCWPAGCCRCARRADAAMAADLAELRQLAADGHRVGLAPAARRRAAAPGPASAPGSRGSGEVADPADAGGGAGGPGSGTGAGGLRDRRPGGGAGRHRSRADGARPRSGRTRCVRCWAGCTPISTWRRSDLPGAFAGGAPRARRPGSRSWMRCWSRRGRPGGRPAAGADALGRAGRGALGAAARAGRAGR